MRAEPGRDRARDAQVPLCRIIFRDDIAELRGDDEAGGGIGVVDFGAVGACDRIAEPGDARAERGPCRAEVAGGIGIGIRRVAGRIQRVEMELADADAALRSDLPAVVIRVVLHADVAELRVATIAEIGVDVARRAVGLAETDVRVAQRGRVHRAAEEVDILVERFARIARVGGRDRQVEHVVVVQVIAGHAQRSVAEVMLDVRADLAAAIVREAVVAVAVVAAQEPADRVIGRLVDRTRLVRVEPVQPGIAERNLRLAARRVGAGHGDVVDDRRGIAGIDRRRAAAHDLDALRHQVEPVDAVAAEEIAVILVEHRQPVLLEGDEATVARQAAQADDVLDLAAGVLDREAGQLAEQVGEVDRRELLDVGVAQRVDRVGDVEAALLASRASNDDVAAAGIRRRGVGCGCFRDRFGRDRIGRGCGGRRRGGGGLGPSRRLRGDAQRENGATRAQAKFGHLFVPNPVRCHAAGRGI